MSYQVLARKWRPRDFKTVAGQEHVLQALIHALDQQRLHHAYLFTGTRGVGKTTLARILAKCLNCEAGISSTPCEQCPSCQEMNSGRFADLIEVDAASNTKVEDTRDLLSNVHYAPIRGRYKIYLIDEVHMLSGHSFNALLKTLEEPPEHVKFLLATTDPQKLPVTVLSRCLQFHLKHLLPERIADYLEFILKAETITFEKKALHSIAKAADGSMRDALSLVDQAIAFSHRNITQASVHALLGTVEFSYLERLLSGLAEKNGKALLTLVSELAEQGVDFKIVLEQLIESLHQIAMLQTFPDYLSSDSSNPALKLFISLFSKESIQLYYQIALIGRRDLPLASNFRMGFEMVLLRMLAFSPDSKPNAFSEAPPATLSSVVNITSPAVSPKIKAPAMTATAEVTALISPVPTESNMPKSLSTKTEGSFPSRVPTDEKKIGEKKFEGTPDSAQDYSPPPFEQLSITPATPPMELLINTWSELLEKLALTGMAKALASNCAMQSFEKDQLRLSISEQHSVLSTDKTKARLQQALDDYFKRPIQLHIQIGQKSAQTPAAQSLTKQASEHQQRVDTLREDQNVKTIMQAFQASFDPDRVKSIA